ncbi:MAG: RDD family protein [Flavitalea sp.]
MENEMPDILQDMNEGIELEDATALRRFAHYLIDALIYDFLAVIGLIAYFIQTGNEDRIQSIVASWGFLERYTLVFFYGLFMSLNEGIFKGQSLGKLITRTKAVNMDGTTITWQTAFKRGLSRIVPFEAISILFGRPWHDQWTNTRVIKLKKY